MRYSVNQVATLTGVTIKTLYHYHKIRLLVPCEITEAGYRLYGTSELERLQQILFYRELDFSLDDIKKALEDEPSRLECLMKQQELLSARRQRMDRLLNTLEESITLAKKGERMDQAKMFQGLNKEEWTEALTEQKEYLHNEYGYEMEIEDVEPEQLNELAVEAEQFMSYLANALKNKWKADDERLQKTIGKHLSFLNDHGISTDANSFVEEAKFFTEDDFHRDMLESQQIGLCYYLYTAAERYAATQS